MYDELIGNLRAQATHFHFNDETSLLLCQAADAIEELQLYVDLYKDLTEKGEKVAREVIDKYPKWIPVTERLPKAERKSYWVCTDTGYQCECRWTNNEFGIGESDKWCWSIFDIPQYQKVVAWMPLPAPPKERE